MKRKLTLVIVTAVSACALLLSGCAGSGFTNPLGNPDVQAVITQLEQEALKLLNDYIHTHLGATSAASSKAAENAVYEMLKANHPGVRDSILRGAAAKAVRG